jgi:hypothetical protein
MNLRYRCSGGPKNTSTVNLLCLGIGFEFYYQIHSIDSQLNYTKFCSIVLIYIFKAQSYVILQLDIQF